MNSTSNYRNIRRFSTTLCAILMLGIVALPATLFAQSRDMHVQGIVINDGTGNTVKIQVPIGGTSYVLTLPASLPPGNYILTMDPTGAIVATSSSSAIEDGAISSAKIADGSIVNADVSATAAIAYSKLALTNSIVAGDLTAGSVTTAKLNSTGASTGQALTFDGTNVVWSNPDAVDFSGSLSGDVTGTQSATVIAADAVNSAKIADGSIVNADISGTAAIAYSKLNLASSIVTGDIVNGTIITADLANDAVTSAKIADGEIVNADINAAAAIAYSKLALTNSIVAGDLTAGSVTTTKLDATGASTGQALTFDGTDVVWGSPDAVDFSGSLSGDVTGTQGATVIASNAVTSAKINDGEIVNADVSGTAAIAYSKLALTNSIVAGDLTAGSVTTAKISSSGASSGNVLSYDGSNVTWSAPTVSTNSSLTGNGTSGSPLGINLSNSNTWTANQTYSGSFHTLANSRMVVTNNDDNARDIRLQEPSSSGNQYVGFRAPAVGANGNYVLPATVGTTGQALTIASSATGGGIGDSATLSWTTITATGSAGGDLTGTYPNPTIAANAVGTSEIADNSITNAKLDNDAVNTAEIADNAVTNAKLADDAVNTAEIANDAVTLAKINTTGAGTDDILAFDGTDVVWAPAPLSGAVVLSFATVGAGATLTIPNNTAVVEVSTDFAAAANAVTMPTGTDGQVLYIFNNDAQALTGGATTAAGAVEKFIYVNGWLLVN